MRNLRLIFWKYMVFTKVSVFVLDNFERSLCDGFRPFHTAVPAEIAICNKKLLNNFGEILFVNRMPPEH